MSILENILGVRLPNNSASLNFLDGSRLWKLPKVYGNDMLVVSAENSEEPSKLVSPVDANAFIIQFKLEGDFHNELPIKELFGNTNANLTDRPLLEALAGGEVEIVSAVTNVHLYIAIDCNYLNADENPEDVVIFKGIIAKIPFKDAGEVIGELTEEDKAVASLENFRNRMLYALQKRRQTVLKNLTDLLNVYNSLTSNSTKFASANFGLEGMEDEDSVSASPAFDKQRNDILNNIKISLTDRVVMRSKFMPVVDELVLSELVSIISYPGVISHVLSEISLMTDDISLSNSEGSPAEYSEADDTDAGDAPDDEEVEAEASPKRGPGRPKKG